MVCCVWGRCGRTCNKLLGCVERTVDILLRITGPLYVVLATALILTVAFVFYTIIFPLRYSIYTLEGAFHATTAFLVIFNVFFNYFYCVFTNPGQPPAVLRPENHVDAEIAERYTR